MELVNSESFWFIEKSPYKFYYFRLQYEFCLGSKFLFYDRQNKIMEIYSSDYMGKLFEQEIEERSKYFGTN